MSLPNPERRPSPRRSSSLSHGNDCQTRTSSSSASSRRSNTSNAPSQPSLSWIATTPREAATFIPARDASSISSTRRAHVAVAEGPRRVLAQDAALLDHSSRHLERPVGALERRAVHPERVVVLRHQRHRQVRHGAVERLAGRRLGPVALAPAEAAQPAALRDASPRLHHAVERLLQRAHALEPRLPQPERPGREVHVRVGEAGQHAALAQLDHPGAGLVVVHDPRAANGQPPHDGGSRVERSDRPAGEQHRRKATRACVPRCAGSRAASPSPRSAGAAPRGAAGSTASRRASRAARRS